MLDARLRQENAYELEEAMECQELGGGQRVPRSSEGLECPGCL